MRKNIFKCSLFSALLFIQIVIMGALTPELAEAKDDENRVRFYGWVESMPDDLQGTWVIGGRQVTTSHHTEFDQVDGPLMVGGCAKVEIRSGRVHEIDSEPDEDCR
ncbi:MAG: hypothetical protein IH613_05950 [Desulfuromonadales bacterium]|nr:hypothetical protein [Desulfuromonadales bacterium]